MISVVRVALNSNPGRTQAILIEGFRGFPQVLQVNSGIIPRLRKARFLPNPFQFIIRPTVQRYVIIRNERIV
jgi:hypothetical protein